MLFPARQYLLSGVWRQVQKDVQLGLSESKIYGQWRLLLIPPLVLEDLGQYRMFVSDKSDECGWEEIKWERESPDQHFLVSSSCWLSGRDGLTFLSLVIWVVENIHVCSRGHAPPLTREEWNVIWEDRITGSDWETQTMHGRKKELKQKIRDKD